MELMLEKLEKADTRWSISRNLCPGRQPADDSSLNALLLACPANLQIEDNHNVYKRCISASFISTQYLPNDQKGFQAENVFFLYLMENHPNLFFLYLMENHSMFRLDNKTAVAAMGGEGAAIWPT